ncbi:hypothetical protein HYC85_030872 [Camellia sinensis]|uniref:Uncharacterized protein n=1 Tax=Camellia sinensis TaxID=4442 RepID=A0A7J7FPL3_CAMSI|nr:hypothetical protein HYC85_030872 [Camellia sinensis]
MLSFSTGRRRCAGVTLGSTMTSMLMARLLQGFTWNLPPTVSHIGLKEFSGDLLLAKPLLALAKPRLAENLYIGLVENGYKRKKHAENSGGQLEATGQHVSLIETTNIKGKNKNVTVDL